MTNITCNIDIHSYIYIYILGYKCRSSYLQKTRTNKIWDSIFEINGGSGTGTLVVELFYFYKKCDFHSYANFFFTVRIGRVVIMTFTGFTASDNA